VGAGLSGAAIARRFAEDGRRVLVIDNRPHIAGNCYDFIEPISKLLVGKYGAHLFHTNSERVWKWINRFGLWRRWDHEVLGRVGNQWFPIPVNISTVNQVCGQNLASETEMANWLAHNQVLHDPITNAKEMAESRVGEHLYNVIFRNYTFKQWAKYPEDLAPSVTARIPIRANFDNRYFADKYQALPAFGYTRFVEGVLKHPNIQTQVNTDFFDYRDSHDVDKIIVFTGPIDRYFADSGLPPLEYRSLEFKTEIHKMKGYYQPRAVVNYPGLEVPYTRIVEYKHFLNQVSDYTVIVKEFSRSFGEPYYPVPTEQNRKLYTQYQELAKGEKNVHFIGRLANYKYFNMDEAILNALEYYDREFAAAAASDGAADRAADASC